MFATIGINFNKRLLRKTRSSERTRIAYFPVNLILKETLMVMGRQTGIGMKDRYLMLIFKILVRIVGSQNRLSNDRRGRKIAQTDGQKIVQTDGNKLLNIGIW